ncbi:MAG: hypothetical protein ACYC63_07955 [Armatimonadota bacterium]
MEHDRVEARQPIGRARRRRALIVGAATLLVAGAAWAATHPWWLLTIGWGNRPFDSAVWRAAPKSIDDPASAENPRGAMLRSLLRDHSLRGLSKPQVLLLLGKPEPSANMPLSVADEWHYYLGCYSGFKIDADFLSLEFGADGRVAEWGVWQT